MEFFRYYHVKTGHMQRILVLALAAMLFAVATPALAGAGGKELDWFKMGMKLFGGLALFLYGMDLMVDAVKNAAGTRLRDILGKLTTNRFMGVISGAGITAVIQSSSITTVMLVGFVSAGLMTLAQAMGVIFGANIGTTITAQIVAFPVKKYALLLITIGFAMMFISKNEKIKQYGGLIMGLGLVFFGMGVMGGAMKPLRSHETFMQLMQNVSNPVIGILVGLGFTAVVQSSSATTGVVIALASQGLLTLEAGIALSFGANIGTCVTAGLACIGRSREAVRVAVAHFTFNVAGVMIIVGFIPMLADLVRNISPVYPDIMDPIEKLAAETPRQVANAHTIFNVFFALLFLPFTGALAKFCLLVVPDRTVSTEEKALAKYKARYLDDLLISTPPMALSMVRRETVRMAEVVEGMLAEVPESLFVGNVDKAGQIRDTDDRVDALYGEIARYLTRVGRQSLTAADADEAMAFVTISSEIENIGDVVETPLYHLTTMCQANDISFSERSMASLTLYHGKLREAFHSAIVAIEHDRVETAEMVLDMEADIVGGIDKLMEETQARFMREEHTPAEMAAFTLETDIMENYKRIYVHIKRIARLVTRQEYGTALVVVPE